MGEATEEKGEKAVARRSLCLCGISQSRIHGVESASVGVATLTKAGAQTTSGKIRESIGERLVHRLCCWSSQRSVTANNFTRFQRCVRAYVCAPAHSISGIHLVAREKKRERERVSQFHTRSFWI